MSAARYSVVVPTYKESGNLDALTRRVFDAMAFDGFDRQSVEMVIVDDNSRDGSVEVVDKLRKEGFNVSIIVREHERGLSSAVVKGLREARGSYLLVMDADLQHPPEVVPSLFRALEKPHVEFVCGTRYGVGIAIDKSWPRYRRILSAAARVLARPLTPLSDPMSGFFALRRTTFVVAMRNLNPIGYKIALEIFVKAHVHKYEEIGFNFATRTVGESKLTGQVIANYLYHLVQLYRYKFGIAFYVMIVLSILTFLYLVYFFIASLRRK